MDYIREHLNEARCIIDQLDVSAIEEIIRLLAGLRDRGGRLFILGVGGGAAHSSHAVNDFRKLAGIEAYTPTDNVSELTARTNDDGWSSVFIEWLKISHLNPNDMLFIFSVGGGDKERDISSNLVEALDYAKQVGAQVAGIVGRDGGYTAKVADSCVVVPVINPDAVTPHTESFQALIWHLIVSHPLLKFSSPKWESID